MSPTRPTPFARVRRWLAAGALLLALSAPAQAIDLSQRSISSTKQFTVYSTDVALRGRVASFAEELKGVFLTLLGQSDHWKYPILLTLERAASEHETPVRVQYIQYEAGLKLQIDVRIGADPSQVNLQKYLLQALCVEYAYRDRPEVTKPGACFQEAPWWFIEGTLQLYHSRQTGIETDLFKRLVDLNHVPALAQFLAQTPDTTAGSALAAVDQGCAFCLVQLLADQPSGHENLAGFLRHLPEPAPDPVQALVRDFPGLAAEGTTPQKWWTLNLARFSAADRYKGLSPEETDAELALLLQFDIPVPKSTEKRSFGIADFEQYLKLPASREVLAEKGAQLVGLGTRANALYRGIVANYEDIFALLARGKTHGVKDRLTRIATYRETVLRRGSDIADYLNWYEATQMDSGTEVFQGYIKAANDFSAPAPKYDPVSRYLDEIAEEF
jgi:hypothetical protein